MPSPTHDHARHVAGLVPVDTSAVDGGAPFVLGIDGRSGAGKSTLASDVVRLLEESPGLHGRVALVRLDAHYTGWSGLLAGVLAIQPLLGALRRGRGGSAPTWDWHRGVPGPPRHLPEPGEPFPRVVVVEGCGTTVLHAELDALAWLDAPPAMRRTRAELREGDVSSWWGPWARQEQDAIELADPARHADLRLEVAP